MLQNPSNLYSAGNVRLDSTPYLRIAESRRARRDAMDEATYRHYSELPDKINSAGVRMQDWEDPNGNGGIANDIQKTKQYFLENSKNIIHGGKEASIYSGMNQNISRQIQQSKNTGKFELDTGKSFFEGKHKPRENDLKVTDAISKSIYDPTHYKNPDAKVPYSYSDYSIAAPAYTPTFQSQFDKTVKGEFKPEYDPATKAVRMDDSGKILLTKRYKPEAIKSMAERAGELAASNQTALYHYDEMMEDDKKVEAATKALQFIYGADEIADSPIKMAKADQIIKAMGTTVEEEETDVKSANAFKKQLQDERLAASLKRTKLVEAGKNARTAAITKQYHVPDVYAEVLELPSENISDPTFGDYELKDVTDLPLEKKTDLYGKRDANYQREHEPVKIGNREYLKVQNGKLVDADNQPIDGDYIFGKTFSRLKPSLEALAKQKAAKGVKPEVKTETKSLAERMKEAKQ